MEEGEELNVVVSNGYSNLLSGTSIVWDIMMWRVSSLSQTFIWNLSSHPIQKSKESFCSNSILSRGHHAASLGCTVMCWAVSSECQLTLSPQLHLPLPLLNTYREEGWALALRLCWAKDSMHKWAAEYRTPLHDSICYCYYAACLCCVWHSPISSESKPFVDLPSGVASHRKQELSDRAIWFRKVDPFSGSKTISFQFLTFTLFYYAQPAATHPSPLLVHFGNLT